MEDLWGEFFEIYRWGWESDLRMGDDMVFHAHINNIGQTFIIQRYNYDHKTSWNLDSQV